MSGHFSKVILKVAAGLACTKSGHERSVFPRRSRGAPPPPSRSCRAPARPARVSSALGADGPASRLFELFARLTAL
jgi:hypothetical protein